MLTVPAPAPFASSIVAASGSKPFGHAQTNSKLNLAANLIQECTMLLPSPTYTTCSEPQIGSCHNWLVMAQQLHNMVLQMHGSGGAQVSYEQVQKLC